MEESMIIFVGNIIILIVGILFIVAAFILYVHEDGDKKEKNCWEKFCLRIKHARSHLPVVFFAVVLVCMFLIIISWLPTIIVGMEISDMCPVNARHYHSMITDIIIGFSTVFGVIITLMFKFKDKGENESMLIRWKIRWKRNRYDRQKIIGRNCTFFLLLWIYFISVMYVVFLYGLNRQIAT